MSGPLFGGHQRHVTRLDNYGSTGSLLPVWCISSSIEMDQTLPTRLTCWACRTNTHFVKDIDSSATPQQCKTTLFFARLFKHKDVLFWEVCKLQGCTASCFFQKAFQKLYYKDLNLTPRTGITKRLQLVHPSCFLLVAWQLTTAFEILSPCVSPVFFG